MRGISLPILTESYPFPQQRPNHTTALALIDKFPNGNLFEAPTGDGKTTVGMTALRAFSKQGKGPLYYVTPTKAQVEQLGRNFPEVNVMMGRSEYPCLFDRYTEAGVEMTAQQSPCYMLDCAHRVDQETGQVQTPGAEPCPYFMAKYQAKERAKSGGITACTTAFFLMNRLMVGGWRDTDPELVVLDEVHQTAKVARNAFEYTLTDYHLLRAARIVRNISSPQAKILVDFFKAFRRMVRKRAVHEKTLLKVEEIEELMTIMEQFDAPGLERIVRQAVRDGKIDTLADRDELKLLENLTQTIPRFVTSLFYAIGDEKRKPLNMVVAFYHKKDESDANGSKRRAWYFLTIKSYYVVPIIQKAIGERLIAYSATIGDPNILKFETGIEKPFMSFSSTFPPEHTRLFFPTDAVNLAGRVRSRNDLNRSLRRIIAAAKKFAARGIRSLVVVTSEEERQKIVQFSEEDGLDVLTYGNGMKAKDAAAEFIRGRGQALVGTSAQYSEGVDLPRNIAPVIFILRPGFQRPDDPVTQFEERRFGKGQCWALWNWRVGIEALQVRGRNVRSADDLGVCFYISSQFRRLLYPDKLPIWLRSAYVGSLTLEQGVEEALVLLR